MKIRVFCESSSFLLTGALLQPEALVFIGDDFLVRFFIIEKMNIVVSAYSIDEGLEHTLKYELGSKMHLKLRMSSDGNLKKRSKQELEKQSTGI